MRCCPLALGRGGAGRGGAGRGAQSFVAALSWAELAVKVIGYQARTRAQVVRRGARVAAARAPPLCTLTSSLSECSWRGLSVVLWFPRRIYLSRQSRMPRGYAALPAFPPASSSCF